MIGQRVDYRGSIDDAWGRYQVVAETTAEDGPRYHLATYSGQVVLHNVRGTSFTPVPDGPKHEVHAAQARVQTIQTEFARQFPPGTWLPYIHEFFEDALPGHIDDLLRRNRPVEAEHSLLQAEKFVGCISHEQLQTGVDALIVAGDDESWM